MTGQNLSGITERFASKRIAVVGDLIADQFLYGEISRVSREAPVLILRHETTETVPGGAANCAANLATLGAQVSLVGCVGTDAAGAALLASLRGHGIDCAGISASSDLKTTTKLRVLAGGAHSTRQQVIRIDYDCQLPSAHESRERLHGEIEKCLATANAIIVSDYNYGIFDAATIRLLRERGRGKIVVVDSRFRLADFAGFTAATPNEDEVEHLTRARLDTDEAVASAGAALREKLNLQTLLVTRGNKGMIVFDKDADAPCHIEAVGSPDAVDVTGAGDTVIATFTLALACGATTIEAAQLANHAGALVVMKRGTATVNATELTDFVHALERDRKD